MPTVKIRIPDRDACARGFAALIRRGRVECYPDNTCIIPEPGLQMLREMGISYIEWGRGDWTNVKRAGHGCTAERDEQQAANN